MRRIRFARARNDRSYVAAWRHEGLWQCMPVPASFQTGTTHGNGNASFYECREFKLGSDVRRNLRRRTRETFKK